MLNYLKREYGFTLLIAVLLLLSILCSCERKEPLSVEDRINAVEPAEDSGTYRVTIGDRKRISWNQASDYSRADRTPRSTAALSGNTVLRDGADTTVPACCFWMFPGGSSLSSLRIDGLLQIFPIQNQSGFKI